MPRKVGDDDLAATGLSSFGNEQPARDDREAVEAEQETFNRLDPVLEQLATIIEAARAEAVSIEHLMIGGVDEQPDMQKVLIELRARSLYLEFIKQFESRITNTRQTLDEIRENAKKDSL
jgi:hypothetical protein